MLDATPCPVAADDVLSGFPISPQQRHLWALEQGRPASPYLAWCTVAIEGLVDAGALESAIATVIGRHEVLRTTFHRLPELELPLQVVADDGGPVERARDLSGLGPQEQEAAIAELLDGVVSRASGARDTGPLLHLALALLSRERALLLVALPALCADGIGLRNLVREIAQAYRIPAGEVMADALQYADLAEWLNGRLEEEAAHAERELWQRARSGGVGARLPFRRPGLPDPAFEPRSLVVEVPEGWAARLETGAAAAGIAPPALLLACWQALLSRLTGCQELSTGVLFDGRSYEGLEDALGLLARYLPIRSEIQGATSLSEVFAAADEAMREAYEAQEYLDWEGGEYCAFGFDFDEATTCYPARGCLFSILEQRVCIERFEVKLRCLAAVGGVRLELHFDAGLYEEGDVERLARQYRAWVDQALADPGICADDIDLLTASERQQILATFEGPAAPPLVVDCIHHLFEQQVRRAPQALAAVCEGQRLTYAELDSRANRLARRLRRLGVGPETLVALYLSRSLELLVGMIATLKAGGAFVPLDPLQPRNRVALMLESLGVPVLLTERALARETGPEGRAVVCVDEQHDPGDEDHGPPAVAVTGENLVYVLFTSGSTGRPKGVAVEHRQLLNYTASIVDRLELPAGASFATVSTFAADLGHTMIFPALCTGGCLHVVPEERVSDAERLADYFAAQRIDCLKIVPSHLEALLAAASRPERLLPRQRLVLGGESCRRELIERLATLAPACRIFNHYGPTETTVGVLTFPLPGGEETPAVVPLGTPIAGVLARVLDERQRPCPFWVAGELHVGGANVARGYLQHPEATAARFVPDPWGRRGERLYRTGDLVRSRPNGTLEFLGRCDDQVKLRGFRIEPGEIAATLDGHPGVRQCFLTACEDGGEKRLAAYVVPAAGEVSPEDLRSFLRARLPEYMIPAFFVPLPALPLSPNGKVDRRALPKPDSVKPRSGQVPPRTELERTIAAIWREVLTVEEIGVDDNFFDLGGHSLLMVRVHARLREAGFELVMTDLFLHPTIKSLVRHLGQGAEVPLAVAHQGPAARPAGSTDIAVIGMAGRFPGAHDVESLWHNLVAGVEAITFFSDEQLERSRVRPEVFNDPGYVGARATLDGGDLFDARFFGYSPREAQLMDPQQRVFLECAWEAIEDGGYDCERFPGRMGVYGGTGVNTYFFNILSNPELFRSADLRLIRLGNRGDFLTTRVSYKLNLKGPSVNVQTGCSTSLVAVCLACASLRRGECDMALAGGVTINDEQENGYLYEEGGIASHDGHVYAFDARGRGTVFGNGVGVVLLKPLQDALADGDSIRAVIKGAALNNDGSLKVGFTAPSVEGQAQAILAAQAEAGVDPASITYVETHGTGTRLGDPIEVAALTRAFRAGTDGCGFCAIGSVKTNLGHLDAAAGVTGLIKAVLALEHRQIPASLNFEQPNPEIPFASSPFYVNTALREWPANGAPRRAGVSSFGIGGTNAHVVLEEAPERPAAAHPRPWQLLLLSARSPAALEAATDRLAGHLASHPEQDLADVAYTLQVGRKVFAHRRALVCRDRQDALAALAARGPERLATSRQEGAGRPVAFLFPGQGTQQAGMAAELYREEPTFRDWVDRGADLLVPHLGLDLRQVLFPAAVEDLEAARRMAETALAQPALFVVEHALARLWMEWGIRPEALLGHSIGEYVAACLAGVFSFDDALALVAARGRLMQGLPAGTMLSVALPEEEVLELLDQEVALAAVNGPSSCVVSGPPAAVGALEERLAGRGVEVQRLRTSHAFHSAMMDPVLDAFAAEVERVELRPPALAYLSNLTGTWITAAEATDPSYWVRHLRCTVRFDAGLRALLARPDLVLLEVGPGKVLTGLARRHPDWTGGRTAIASLRHPRDPRPDLQCLLSALGGLWLAGVEIDWKGFHAEGRRYRTPLPTYPFERQRYWVEPRSLVPARQRLEPDGAWTAPDPGRALPAGPSVAVPVGDRGTMDVLERELALLWQELLGVERVGVHDDFFELGGSSVTAVRLGARLRQRFDAKLSPDVLLEAPTIAGMAELLKQAINPIASTELAHHSCLVEIQKGNPSRRPLYLVHPVGGHVYYYRGLARELETEQPVYGLRARGLEEGEETLATIEEIAAHYVGLVRTRQPTGPYLLGGSSLGGIVAFEMAQQLLARGQEVALLALLDTPGPEQMPPRPSDEADLVARLFGNWLPVTPEELRRLHPEERLTHVEELIRSSGLFPEDLTPGHVHRHVRVATALWQAMFDYRPRPYPGRILFFRARERRPLDPAHPELAWTDLAESGTEIQVVPGNHTSMHFPPHIGVLGAKLRKALDAVLQCTPTLAVERR